MRRTIHPRRRLGPVNPMEETTSTSKSDTRSETISTSREERHPDRGWLVDVVKAHTISLACVQGRTNEAGSPEGELHRGCQEDAEWSESIRQ